MVVRVVVMDRSDGEGEEKVLSLSPSVRVAVVVVPLVPVVPTPDLAVSEMVVSAVVPMVGARDLGGPCPSCDNVNETFSLEFELCLEVGEDSRLGDIWLSLYSFWVVLAWTLYGWFLAVASFLVFCLEVAFSLCRFLRLANRFIQLAKGLRRAWRSG